MMVVDDDDMMMMLMMMQADPMRCAVIAEKYTLKGDKRGRVSQQQTNPKHREKCHSKSHSGSLPASCSTACSLYRQPSWYLSGRGFLTPSLQPHTLYPQVRHLHILQPQNTLTPPPLHKAVALTHHQTPLRQRSASIHRARGINPYGLLSADDQVQTVDFAVDPTRRRRTRV